MNNTRIFRLRASSIWNQENSNSSSTRSKIPMCNHWMFCLVTFQPRQTVLSHSKPAVKSKNWESCSLLPLIPGLSPSHWQITTFTPQLLPRYSKSSGRGKMKGSHQWESTSAEDWQTSAQLHASSSHGICPWIQGHSLEGVKLSHGDEQPCWLLHSLPNHDPTVQGRTGNSYHHSTDTSATATN